MEEPEPYEIMPDKYRVYGLVLEFVVIPAIAVLGGYALGSPGSGIAIAAGYFGADILTMLTRHRTLTGIRLSRPGP